MKTFIVVGEPATHGDIVIARDATFAAYDNGSAWRMGRTFLVLLAIAGGSRTTRPQWLEDLPKSNHLKRLQLNKRR